MFSKLALSVVALATTMGLIAPLPLTADESSYAVPEIVSPPGQVQIVTVNAKQNRILGVKRFSALLNLVRGLRTRPPAFNGGPKQAVAMPDVIVLQEMLPATTDVMARLLRQRSKFDYQVIGKTDAAARLIVNLSTITVAGDPITWADPCSIDPDKPRIYQLVRLVENATNHPFLVAGVHLRVHSSEDCRRQNVRQLRLLVAAEAAPVFVGGDFNRRPVSEALECDPYERSQPFEWWTEMTTPDGTDRAFVDAIREWHRSRGRSLASEWTRERVKPKVLCNGLEGYKRSRIDYLFARGAIVADAHADHPGWSGEEPGTSHPENGWYSDHRWVWGRFVLANVPRADRPVATPRGDGIIELSWAPVEGATHLVVYRGRPSKPYRKIALLPAESLGMIDDRTRHGRTYRYAIAARGPGGAQGLESRPVRSTSDAVGPKVIRALPRSGASGIRRNRTISVRFDERFTADSVQADSIQLFKKDRRVPGRVIQVSRRILEFEPKRWLRRKTTYRVVAPGLRDALGNRGIRFAWRFTTGKR